MKDYIQKTDLTEIQRNLLEQINYSSGRIKDESSFKVKDSFFLSDIEEHGRSIHKLVHDLKKEFRLQ